ncbi:DUF1028 domain-containing protein [Metasolibacillus fluoroglycofenilyticus]|uniref:DUF1028 domain-containing protein n=1 Tax=Metasolibacillus fluoroglycofenilyticus TaxID=1239396 RepID=UPI001913A246|nr:DUF1028 domain-containing protein [Metasolibacillus fluoroglycofenilyticus]
MKKNIKLNTFSIVGFDPMTGELGIAVASKFLAVGAVVPYAKAGVGAIATQSWANLSYGPEGLALLEQGLTPEQAIEQLIKDDEQKEYRQIGIVDAKGGSASFTGRHSYAWAGGKHGVNFAAQGNILAGENVVEEMVEAFQSNGTLAERLLKALLAGDKAGGDARGKQSASLLIAKENGSYGGYNDKAVDLRVDDHEEPVKELLRLYDLHCLYFNRTKEEDLLTIDKPLQEEINQLLYDLKYVNEKNLSDEQFYSKLQEYQLVENFDERFQEQGYIDRLVLQFMRDKASNK